MKITGKNLIFLKAVVVLMVTLAFIMPGTATISTEEIQAINGTLATIYVDDDNIAGPWDGTQDNPYQFIQDGIDAASSGDTVFVFDGTYIENLTIDKPLDLQGESMENTIVTFSLSDDQLQLNSDNVNIDSISFVKTGFSMNPGVFGDSCSYISFTNCDFEYIGNPLIQFEGTSSECTDINIIDCHFYRPGGDGIDFTDVSNSEIIGCEFEKIRVGIGIWSGSNHLIKDCIINASIIGVGIGPSEGQHDVDIISCDIISGGSSGIAGITFMASDMNIIDCVIDGYNEGIGLGASRTTVVGNIISNCYKAIVLTIGSLNTFHHNDIIGSIMWDVYVPTGSMTRNSWDDGYEGNHWSVYDEPSEGAWDNDTDGIVDDPHVINIYNQDNFPLVEWKPAPPKIVLLYPNGGELEGANITIEWTQVTDITGEPIENAKIFLDYNVDGGPWQPIDFDLDDTGSYVWDTREYTLEDNTEYLIRIGATSEGETGYDISDEEFAIDATPPTIEISRPLIGDVYLGDALITNISFLKSSLVIGPITMIVDVDDEMSGIDHVLFELSDGNTFDDTEAPYSWIFNERAFGRRTLTVTVYDIGGLSTTAETSLLIFNLGN